MKKSIYFLILLVLNIFLSSVCRVSAQSPGIVSISAIVIPADAKNFQSTPNYNPGAGECELTWITSTTPNIINQFLEIHGPQGPGVDFTTLDIPFPGTSLPDSIIINNLVIGEAYWFKLISQGTINSSAGVVTDCTPTTDLPTPVLTGEPLTTPGPTNTVYWNNGDAADLLKDVLNTDDLECEVTASLTNLDDDMLGVALDSSGWIDCPDDSATYEYTFMGLPYNQDIYYHVWSRNMSSAPVEYSVFSNVEHSMQSSGGGGGNPPANYCGDGRVGGSEQCDDGNTVKGDGCYNCQTELAVSCGDSVIQIPEECDDGNHIDADGCSSICEIEETAKVTFTIHAVPQFRIAAATHPNLDLSAIFGFYKPSNGSLTSANIVLDHYGNAIFQGIFVTGDYDIGINGIAHNTEIIRGIVIDAGTTDVDLNYETAGSPPKLVAGDIKDDNIINALDMARLLIDYRRTGPSDLNNWSGVNALDFAILLRNYKKVGDQWILAM